MPSQLSVTASPPPLPRMLTAPGTTIAAPSIARATSRFQDPEVPFIQKVRFFLHPSFAPNDLVEVAKPPFELRRSGWGEFPLRVQLFLIDGGRNKPVDVIHMLKVCKLGCTAHATVAVAVPLMPVMAWRLALRRWPPRGGGDGT